jgi:hypothetical protein
MMLAAIDTTFYIWIMMSLNNILISLAARKQAAKYQLYQHFRLVLALSLLLSLGWAVYSVLVVFGDHVDKNWSERWTIDALWEVTYLVIFIAIAYLWAPSRNSQRYAYSVELASMEEDVEKDSNRDEEAEDARQDQEYGGSLQDDDDPFQGTGALDPSMAIAKKN